MKKAKRILSLVLVVALLAVATAACGTDDITNGVDNVADDLVGGKR